MEPSLQARVLLAPSVRMKLQIHHFFQFLTHKSLLFFLFQVVDVQAVVVPCAAGGHSPAARRDEEENRTELLPALAALKPSYLQENFPGASKHRGKARGVTALFTTHLNCNGGQEMELYSSENGNSFGFGVSGGPDRGTRVLT